jgi:beta-lactamase class A
MLSRRELIASATGSAALAITPVRAKSESFAALESKGGGRLGIAALDTGSGHRLAYRGGERFPMCSTFKLLAIADLLHRVNQGHEHLDRWIKYAKADVLEYAPVTRAHAGEGGMRLGALAAAAAQWSDNTAANLVLAQLGGPAGVTAYVRSLGDTVTRIDRTEPDANTCIPGDPRDTTSPSAMLGDMKTLLVGRALSSTSRAQLLGWLVNMRTPFPRLSAGLPKNWKSGHKMGTGANDTANDLAIVWPPGRAPILIAAFYTGSRLYPESRDAVLADAGRIIAKAFTR